jgi:hypothetical protein
VTNERAPCTQCGSRKTLGELQEREKFLSAQWEAERRSRRGPPGSGRGGMFIRREQLCEGVVLDASVCANCGCIYDAEVREKIAELKRKVQELEFKLDPPLTNLARAVDPDEFLDP